MSVSPYLPAIIVFFGAMAVAGGTFWGAYNQANSGRALREKSDRLAELQIDAANSITGGDSFCIVLLQPARDIGGVMQVMILPKGKYPLYDVGVRFADLDVPFEDGASKSMRESFNIGNVIPLWGQSPPIRLQHFGLSARYNIFFAARNGGWTQQTRVLRLGNGYARADVVEMNGKEVYREVSENYPRTSAGEVDWDAKGL